MELKDVLNTHGIVGVIGNYQNKIDIKGKVKDIPLKDISKALKMVLLDDDYLDKNIEDLSISEYFKIVLMSKLEDDVIIIGNLSNTLIYKDREYIKKLLIKLNKDYNKKIVVIDQDLRAFFDLVKYICVVDNNSIIYSTDNYFDEYLYKYVNAPRIVGFINYINRNNKRINETTDIYELIKDIFRCVS